MVANHEPVSGLEMAAGLGSPPGDLPFRSTHYPLGFRLELAADSSAVCDAAARSWSRFGPEFDFDPVCIELRTRPGRGPAITPSTRWEGNLLTVESAAGELLVCDLARGFARGTVLQCSVDETAFFRYHYLDAAVLSMLAVRYLAPVHGALIARGGRGVLLCGPSRAGKSTLAYTCARNGWTLISDDATYFLRGGAQAIGIGNPWAMRFREDAKSRFRELQNHAVTLRVNGQFGIEVNGDCMPPIHRGTRHAVSDLVFLERGGSTTAKLLPINECHALRCLSEVITIGDGRVHAEQMRCLRRLVLRRPRRLLYAEASDAAALLSREVDGGYR